MRLSKEKLSSYVIQRKKPVSVPWKKLFRNNERKVKNSMPHQEA